MSKVLIFDDDDGSQFTTVVLADKYVGEATVELSEDGDYAEITDVVLNMVNGDRIELELAGEEELQNLLASLYFSQILLKELKSLVEEVTEESDKLADKLIDYFGAEFEKQSIVDFCNNQRRY
jgi:hypothetical protein